MRIALLVEGDTEHALKEHIKRFLDERSTAAGHDKVGLRTRKLLVDKKEIAKQLRLELTAKDTVAVVALVDVYPYFESSEAAKAFLSEAAGNDSRFYAHVARHDAEAWLLPFWDEFAAALE